MYHIPTMLADLRTQYNQAQIHEMADYLDNIRDLVKKPIDG